MINEGGVHFECVYRLAQKEHHHDEREVLFLRVHRGFVVNKKFPVFQDIESIRLTMARDASSKPCL